jgi:hypothetical protein
VVSPAEAVEAGAAVVAAAVVAAEVPSLSRQRSAIQRSRAALSLKLSRKMWRRSLNQSAVSQRWERSK